VDRPYEACGSCKAFGCIVDYEGSLVELDDALTVYAAFDGYGEEDVSGWWLLAVTIELNCKWIHPHSPIANQMRYRARPPTTAMTASEISLPDHRFSTPAINAAAPERSCTPSPNLPGSAAISPVSTAE
jgi:hypothetical protein